MAVLTLNVPVREDFLDKIDKAAQSESSSRADLVNKAIDAYLRRKMVDEFFTMCDDWVRENNITKELVDDVLREYKMEQNGK